jgi:SAM-dependent methyltransferase
MTSSLASKTANADQIQGWNEAQGKTWAMLHERLNRQIEPIGWAAMAKAAFRPGEAVLDIGCGCGETTFEVAAKVAPGEVLGVDVSTMLLDIARVAGKDTPNVSFLEADAQTHALPQARFDVLFSRFGVMFFDDPAAAFANLAKALKSGGRLAFACWRGPKENLWLSLPIQAVGHMLPPMPPSDPEAPGPMAFANPERVRRILTEAGFVDIAIDPLDLRTGGDSLEDSAFLALRIGPLGSALRQLGAPDELKAKVDAGLRQALAPYLEDGVVKLPSATWIVSARKP